MATMMSLEALVALWMLLDGTSPFVFPAPQLTCRNDANYKSSVAFETRRHILPTLLGFLPYMYLSPKLRDKNLRWQVYEAGFALHTTIICRGGYAGNMGAGRRS